MTPSETEEGPVDLGPTSVKQGNICLTVIEETSCYHLSVDNSLIIVHSLH